MEHPAVAGVVGDGVAEERVARARDRYHRLARAEASERKAKAWETFREAVAESTVLAHALVCECEASIVTVASEDLRDERDTIADHPVSNVQSSLRT